MPSHEVFASSWVMYGLVTLHPAIDLHLEAPGRHEDSRTFERQNNPPLPE